MTPSMAARAIFALVKFEWVIPAKDPRACGRLGVRSPSKCAITLNPSAPSGALSASELNSSKEIPRVFATVSKTFAALRVQASGKKFPVASAKPATSPDGS